MKTPKIGIIASRFNPTISTHLLEGTLLSLESHGIPKNTVDVVWVPGAFEIPLVAKKRAQTGAFDALICLGSVIRGETPHFDYVCAEAASGVARASYESEVPIIFGVLTTDTLEQALYRADPNQGNKGKYLADAALEMIQVINTVPSEILT